MKPIGERQYPQLGQVNEDLALRHLSRFLALYAPEWTSDCDPIDFGLVAQKDKPYIATSIDGYVLLSQRTGPVHCSLETKTTSSVNTEQAQLDVVRKASKFIECKLDSDLFRQCIFDALYQVHVLQHASTLSVNVILIIVTNANTIKYCTLVHLRHGYTHRFHGGFL